jgi:hypothetical protein
MEVMANGGIATEKMLCAKTRRNAKRFAFSLLVFA